MDVYLADLKVLAPLKFFARSKVGKVPKFCEVDRNGLVTGVKPRALKSIGETLPGLLGNIKRALFSRAVSENVIIRNAAQDGLKTLAEIVSPSPVADLFAA